jgi:hypothetical protein
VIAAACRTALAACALLAWGLQDGKPSSSPASSPAATLAAKPRPTMPRQHGNPIPQKPEAGHEPRLVLEKEFHEFGDVDEGPEYETEYRFKNEGKGDLLILGEVRHCGCADTWYEVGGKLYDWGSPIPPGAGGIVHFVLKTVGFANDKPSQVDVITNDPSRPPAVLPSNTVVPFGAVPLRVHANIRRQFAVEPSNAITIGSIYNMDTATYAVRVRSLFEKPIEVLGIEPSNDPLFRAKAICENPNKTSWKVEVTIPPGQPPQTVTKTFKLVTKPELPNPTVYVLGTIRGAVQVEPTGQVPFGVITKGQAALRQVTVSNKNSSLPLAIANLRLQDPRGALIVPAGDPRSPKATIADHLNVTVLETQPGKEAKISIEIRESMPAGPGTVRIVFETGIPGGPASITIPVSWIVR